MGYEVVSNIKDRRKYRRFTPMFYMTLEVIGIMEIVLIGYSILGDYLMFKILSIALALLLMTISYNKTKAVYQRSYPYHQPIKIAMQPTFSKF